MQYSQGICAATARPTSSFIFGGTAVIGLTCNALNSVQAPGSARSGMTFMKPGTNPNVFWMSARAASASGVASAARGATTATATENNNSGMARTVFTFVMASPPGWNVRSSRYVIATRKRLPGYGAIVLFAVGLLVGALPAVGRASSISFQTIMFGRAVAISARVVKGKVTARAETKIDGATLHYVDIAVDAALKGTPAKAGERVRVF